MKIAEILSEAQVTPYRRESLSGDITELLSKHCSSALKTMRFSPLWRGTRSNRDEILLLDPSSGSRKSENTTNYYTMLMDNSPYMRGWPKRSNSFIGTTRRSMSESYGNGYAIFPFDGAKIAICPYGDLWDTVVDLSPFRARKSHWENINYVMRDLGFSSDASWDDIISHLSDPEFAEKLELDQGGLEVKITPDKFIPWLWGQMAPGKVGFELKDVGELNVNEYTNNEVWFSSPCIAIRGDIYDAWIQSTT